MLHELLNPGHPAADAPPGYDPRTPLAAQAVRYDTRIAVAPEALEVDGWRVGVLSVQQYPEQWHGGMRETIGRSLHALEQIGVPCWWSMTALRLDQQRAAAQLGKRHVVASNQAFGPLVRLIPVIGKKKEHLDRMMHAVTEGRHLWAVGHQLVLYAPEPAALDEAVESATALFRGLGWQLQRDRYIGLIQWLAALPMQATPDAEEARSRLRRLKTLHSAVAAAVAPIVGDWKGTPQRPVLLYTSRSGQLVAYDLYANPSGNYNVCVAAKSGAGKSFWVNDLIRAYLSIGGRVWMIDAGNSYRTLADLLGERAAYIQWSKEAKALALNPFAAATDREPETVTQIRGVLGQMACPSRALSDWERAVLDEVVAAALEASGAEATVTEVRDRLKAIADSRAADLATQLSPYARGGMYAEWFHRSGRLPWDAPFIVLELDGLQQQQELRSVILMQLLLAIQQEMYLGDRATRKLCAMDEAWDLLSKAGHTADFFETGVRRVRKYNGSIIVITQGVDDFYHKLGQVGRALLQNSDYLVLPMQKPESIAAIKQQEQLAMSEGELKLLETVFKTDEYAEFMFCLPGGREVLRHVVDEESKLIYTTKADDLAAIARVAREEGVTRLEAIRRLVARRAAHVGGLAAAPEPGPTAGAAAGRPMKPAWGDRIRAQVLRGAAWCARPAVRTPAAVLGLVLALGLAASPWGQLLVRVDESWPHHRVFWLWRDDEAIERGDLVAFVMTEDLAARLTPPDARTREYVRVGQLYLKRVLGLPGDRVTVEPLAGGRARIRINGIVVGETLGRDRLGRPIGTGPLDPVIPPGSYYLALDYPRSFDSRYLGYVSAGLIEGRVVPLW